MAKASAKKFEKEMQEEVASSDEWEEIGMTPAWDFDKEKELSGVYVFREEHVGPHDSVVYQVQKADGSTIAVWDNTVLADKFSKLNIGDEIKITYKGKTESENGRQYNDFRVIRRKKKIPDESGESGDNKAQKMPF